MAARVIGRESDTWSRMIVIDRGTMNGIANDMPVVTPQGLVGRVVEAGLNSSKVQLILDPRSSVGTIVQRAESRVTGSDNNYVIMFIQATHPLFCNYAD